MSRQLVEARGGNGLPLRRRLGSALTHVAVLCLGGLLLCAPALYNGYPLLFADLLDYAGDGMKIIRGIWPSGNHPPFYGVAIELVDLERTLWPIVLIQGLIVAHVLYVVLRSIGVRLSSMAFLAFIAGMTVLTSLPWYVSVVMPDIFGGVAILTSFLLLFRGRALGTVEKLYFTGLAIASLLFHVSFFPVVAGIVGIALVLALLGLGKPRPKVAIGVLVLGAALAVSGLISVKFWGNLGGPPYAPPYLLAHVLVDGPGKEFLSRQCGVQHFVLCDYQDDIPDDVEEFMFRSYSPFFSSWKTKQIRSESSAIVVGTFKMFPLQTIQAALRDGLKQLVTFYTEVAQLGELPNDAGGSFETEFAVRLPFVARGYAGTAQADGLLSPARLRPLNDLDAAVVLLSTILMLAQMVVAARRRNWPVLELLIVVAAGVVINGLVAGAAVGVFGRFGARVIWLLPFGAIAAALVARRPLEHGMLQPQGGLLAATSNARSD